MKRFLSAVVSLSLLVVTPAPAAWSAVATVVSGAAAPAAPGAQAGGAVRLSGPVQLANTGVSVAPLSGSAVFAAAPSVLPTAVSVAAPAANVSRIATPASMPAAVPIAPIVNVPVVDAQGQLSETGKALAAPAAKKDGVIARLFTGALGRRGLDVEPVSAPLTQTSPMPGLERSSAREGKSAQLVPSSPKGTPNAPQGSTLLGAAKALGLFALGAVAAVGLQLGAVALAPALFAVVPVAAVWAVSGGLMFFPVALYARYRLSLRDSPRLNKVKMVLDLALGAYTGALVIAAPSLLVVLTGAGLITSALPAAGLLAGMAVRGLPFLDSVMVWGALGLTPIAVAAAATGGMALAPILGMMSLPVMTTIAFFLGRLIYSAETGSPFSVPGSLQKLRFPNFPWVMTGVVFALLAGYAAVYTTPAFLAWNLLGMRSPADWEKSQPLWKNILNKAADFNVVYLGVFAAAAVTGFTSPLTFLVIAFAGERAAVWTEKLLTRILPRAKPAPSTPSSGLATPASDLSVEEGVSGWPQYHYWAKTGAILASMAGIGVMMGFEVFGFQSLLGVALPAVALSFLPFFFAHKIIKAVMKSEPADEASNPEFFSIMRDLRERINTDRRAAGKKEIPMPEMVIDPMPVPNAYATGRSPFKALVGVTVAIKDMTLDAESVRGGVVRLLSGVPADSKAFRVFRLAVAGSISGVSLTATPTEVQSAVLKADRAELKALGVRALRGVLGHEFSHVMDRHMLSGAIAGAISMSISFASYGVLWAVGKVETAVKKVFDRILGRSSEKTDGGRKTLEPITIGSAARSLPALIRLFAALWVPVTVQIVQMASSRSNEGMADEDGARLSADPASLALALGMLTTWRPKEGFALTPAEMSKLAAMSPLMTVNPIQQADEAGVLPKLDAITSAVVGKGDDFLFNLFITHPDTLVRINKLADMAEAMRAAKNGGRSGMPSSRISLVPQTPRGSATPAAPVVQAGEWTRFVTRGGLDINLRLPREGKTGTFILGTLSGDTGAWKGGALPNVVNASLDAMKEKGGEQVFYSKETTPFKRLNPLRGKLVLTLNSPADADSIGIGSIAYYQMQGWPTLWRRVFAASAKDLIPASGDFDRTPITGEDAKEIYGVLDDAPDLDINGADFRGLTLSDLRHRTAAGSEGYRVSFDAMTVPAQLADALSGLRSRGLRATHPIFFRMPPVPVLPASSEDKQVSEQGALVKFAFKFLDAFGAVVSFPGRVAMSMTRFVSKTTGLSPEGAAAALGVVSMGASFGLMFLGGPLFVSGALLMMSGLFVAYSVMLMNPARKQSAAKPSVAPETSSADFKIGDQVRPVDAKFAAAFGSVGTVTYVGEEGVVEVMFPNGSGGMFPKRFFEKTAKSERGQTGIGGASFVAGSVFFPTKVSMGGAGMRRIVVTASRSEIKSFKQQIDAFLSKHGGEYQGLRANVTQKSTFFSGELVVTLEGRFAGVKAAADEIFKLVTAGGAETVPVITRGRTVSLVPGVRFNIRSEAAQASRDALLAALTEAGMQVTMTSEGEFLATGRGDASATLASLDKGAIATVTQTGTFDRLQASLSEVVAGHESEFKAIDGFKGFSIDLKLSVLHVSYDPATVSENDLLDNILDIERDLKYFTVMCGVAAAVKPAGTVGFAEDAQPLSALNKAVADILAPVNDSFTKAKVVFTELATNAVRAVKLLLSMDYKKKGDGGAVGFKIDHLSYSYPETDGAKPTTKVKASLSVDLLKIVSQEQVNSMGPMAANIVESFIKDQTSRYGAAATVSAGISRMEHDKKGNLTALGITLNGEVDLAKLPAGVDAKDVQFTGITADVGVTLKGVTLDLSLVSNPLAKAFEQDQEGLKEGLDKLLARDPELLARIGRFVKQLDQYAATLTRKNTPVEPRQGIRSTLIASPAATVAQAGDFKVGDEVRPVDAKFAAAFGPVGTVTYVGEEGVVEVMFPDGSGGMFPKRFFEKI